MKLFVAKLPQHITSERLKAMFEAYGQVVDAKIIMDRETNKSKCYGFVEMADASSGNAAIEHLNGTQMEGKEILVKESDPAPPRSEHGGGNRGGGGGGFRPSFNSGGELSSFSISENRFSSIPIPEGELSSTSLSENRFSSIPIPEGKLSSTSLSENRFPSIPISEGELSSTSSSEMILCSEKILSIILLLIHGLFIVNHFLTDELKDLRIFLNP